jgi:hypothetical protein
MNDKPVEDMPAVSKSAITIIVPIGTAAGKKVQHQN